MRITGIVLMLNQTAPSPVGAEKAGYKDRPITCKLPLVRKIFDELQHENREGRERRF